jgi:chromosome segregation ATPase
MVDDISDVAARVDAIERAVVDGDGDLDTAELATLAADVESLAERIECIEQRLGELDSAVQAVRGYAGNVRSVNREVERRADAALAKVEELEASERERDTPDSGDSGSESGGATTAQRATHDSRAKRTHGETDAGERVAQANERHVGNRRMRRDDSTRTGERPTALADGSSDLVPEYDEGRDASGTTEGRCGDCQGEPSGSTRAFLDRVRDAL